MVSDRFPVPDTIPGIEIVDHDTYERVQRQLVLLTDVHRFPGAQPVSFTKHSLKALEKEDYWVCEKSDGVRVLVMILGTQHGSEVYFVDRKERFFLNMGFPFPDPEDPLNELLMNTVLDGELVIDVDQQTGKHQLRLLCFDLLVYKGRNYMREPFYKRFARLKECVCEPFLRFVEHFPDVLNDFPFDVRLKTMEKAYGIEAVFKEHLPRLEHGSDGLIFTSAVAPYTPGTDEKILKWKPPEENSIDFRLELRFPPLPDKDFVYDKYAKPIMCLMMNRGQKGEVFFDVVDVSDEEWEQMKLSKVQFDKFVDLYYCAVSHQIGGFNSRVVEVAWIFEEQTWKILRFRDDKREGNYFEVVRKILDSIKDAVAAEELIQNAGSIKGAWRAREEKLRLADQVREARSKQGNGVPVSNGIRKRWRVKQGRPPTTKLPLKR